MTTFMYLDGPSLVYRAFFAVPKTIVNADGRPVNAVRGVMDMVARLKIDRKPQEIVAVLDADWRPAFRVSAHPAYKADRPPMPPELEWQFELLEEVLDAAGVATARSEGYEADDVIATLAAGVSGVHRSTIVTGDRDFLCCVRDPHVSVLFTVRGVSELKEFDEAAVQEEYGILPELYCELAMLRGDPSDGLPGVAGIGPTRAAKLLGEHGSIAGIYDNLDAIPARQAAAFEAAREYLKAMRKVVPPVRDVPVSATSSGAPDEHRLIELAERNNLEGAAMRLWDALGRGGRS